MITWIAFAKTMAAWSDAKVPFTTDPLFESIALERAEDMAAVPHEAMMDLLNVNENIALRTCGQYQRIRNGEAEQMPALAAYSGAVFKRIAVRDFDTDDWLFAQDHLRIMSSLYGILRPLDRISAYRLDATSVIAYGKTVAESWRPLLTGPFISLVKDSGGVLLDLASEEMRLFLDWEQVCSSVRVVKADFYERRSGRLKSVTMFAKMCRGEMARYVIRNRIDNPGQLTSFTWDGFAYDASESTAERMVFVRQQTPDKSRTV